MSHPPSQRHWRRLAGLAVVVMSMLGAPSAHALDPLVLYLLRSLRDKAVSASVESVLEQQELAAARPAPLPDLSRMTDAELSRLVDSSFLHLTPAQRAEVFASIQRILADPANAVDRPEIVAQIRSHAAAARQTHDMLDGLNVEQKRRVAREARAAYELLGPPERSEMVQMLQSRALPLPGDLHDMILAELAAADGAAAR